MEELIKRIKLRLHELREENGDYLELDFNYLIKVGRIGELENLLCFISSLGYESVGDE